MNEKMAFLQTFGCQMNKLDSGLVTSALKQAGFCLTDSEKKADVVVINTCSVREHAEKKVFSHLGHLKHIRQTRPNLTVAVIGCMAQRLGGKLLDHEAIDIVCGPAQKPIPDKATHQVCLNAASGQELAHPGQEPRCGVLSEESCLGSGPM